MESRMKKKRERLYVLGFKKKYVCVTHTNLDHLG